MHRIRETSKFRKSLKRYVGSGRFNREQVQSVVEILARGEKLDIKYRDHELTGKYKGTRECHIKPDLLLLYKIEEEDLILILLNLGSHSDLFG